MVTYECNNLVGLECPSTAGVCNCPSNSSTIFCDCLRTFNNEFFWNGSACQSALSFNQICTDPSSSYMCQTVTQGTICNGTNTYYTCQCPYLQYMNALTNKCTNQFGYNQSCNSSISNICQASLGLNCILGVCK